MTRFRGKNLVAIIGVVVSFLALISSLIAVLADLQVLVDPKIFERFSAVSVFAFAVILGIAVNVVGQLISYADSRHLFQKIPGAKRVFLSYPRNYEETATAIATSLKKRGVKVWLASERIQPGDNWVSSMNSAVKASDIVVMLISKNPESVALKELDLAQTMKKRIIPVLVEDAQIPVQLQNISFADLRSETDKGIASIVDAVMA